MSIKIPDDGYKVPDEVQGEERRGDWILRWSGWLIVPSSGGFTMRYGAFWSAWNGEMREALVVAANGPEQRVLEGGTVDLGDGMSALRASYDGRAAQLKAEARARILAMIDREEPGRLARGGVSKVLTPPTNVP